MRKLMTCRALTKFGTKNVLAITSNVSPRNAQLQELSNTTLLGDYANNGKLIIPENKGAFRMTQAAKNRLWKEMSISPFTTCQRHQNFVFV